jgi:hypothetical protein
MKKPNLVLFQGNGFTIQGPKRFKKDILRVGRWKHPVTGQDVEITQERIQRLAAATEQYRQTMDRKAIPFPDGHTFDAKKNLGYWTEFGVEGDRLVGTVEVTDEEAARKIEQGSIRSVSARIDPDLRDTAGNVYAEAMTHVCATPIPVLDGQQDFVKLSREVDRLDLLIPEPLSGDKPKEQTMDIKKMALALGLDPEKATAEQVLEAAVKAGQSLKTLTEKVKGFEGLSAVKPEELKAHGFELKDGKVVKLAAAPPSDETPREKELREKLEKIEREQQLARLGDVKRQVEEFSKAGVVPPALVPAFTELASIQSEVQALTLSADGTAAPKAVKAFDRVLEILKGLPKIGEVQLSQSAKEQDEDKKLKESAKAKASEVLARVTGGK